MIPPDLASRLRLATQDLPAPTQPAAAIQKLTDVLSDLHVGQRIMAEIQTLLPNGAYRAIVAQRDITLALPFSAKSGDTLELEVVENDGKLTLSLVGKKSADSSGEAGQGNSVSSTLSKTGSLIGDLLREVDERGGKPKPALLNANQPLVETMPAKAADLAPILRNTLSQSGMFYESHQAQWVAGKLPASTLLGEPQGLLSPVLRRPQDFPSPVPVTVPGPPEDPRADMTSVAASPDDRLTPQAHPHEARSHQETPATAARSAATEMSPGASPRSPGSDGQPSIASGTSDAPGGLPREVAPVVQQQLNGLATQTYVWQGQIWPGQTMEWEIAQENGDRQAHPDAGERQWQTRLRLDLPHLGNIEASLRLSANGTLDLRLNAGNDDSVNRLRGDGGALQSALEAAGLQMGRLDVVRDVQPPEQDAAQPADTTP